MYDKACNTKSPVKEGYFGLLTKGADLLAFYFMTEVKFEGLPGLARASRIKTLS